MGSRVLTLFPGVALMGFAALGAVLLHVNEHRAISTFADATCNVSVSQEMLRFVERYSFNSRSELCGEDSRCCTTTPHPPASEEDSLGHRLRRKLEAGCATQRLVMQETRREARDRLFYRLFAWSTMNAQTPAVLYSLEPWALRMRVARRAEPEACAPKIDLSSLSFEQQLRISSEYAQLIHEMSEKYMEAVP